ncbi:hypothetical protein PSHT_01292 [Puccinia striiformis]|uniref:Uncharacterized protein n=1 Tax=Puccinia striiformis TaxID=27350 RepID=A0A2S4WKZ4_9BASI|nr:hypothetical protein PSHT_01292 [Puccinia striiformis]
MYWCTGIKGLACRLAKAKAGSGNELQYSRCYGRPRLVKASLANVQSASNCKLALKSCNLIRKGTTLILKIIRLYVQLSAVPVLSVVKFQSPTSIVRFKACDRDLEEQNEAEEDEFIFDHHVDDLFIPAPYIISVSFSKYCSYGMRQSVTGGHQVRTTLRSTCYGYSGLLDMNPNNYTKPNQASQRNLLSHKAKLEAVHSSKYMESAITQGVSDKILLRGGVEVE